MDINCLKVGDKANVSKNFTSEDVIEFSKISGDVNPIHLDESYVKKTIFKKRIVHGMLVASLISNVIGNKLPGKGSIYLSQNLKFVKPVMINDTIVAEVEIIKINKEKKIVTLKTRCYKDEDIDVIIGEAEVLL